MKEFFEYIGMIGIDSRQQVVTGIVRILLATLLGALIGMERGRKNRPAGLRTHTLVCIASALVMITNEQLIIAYGGGDPTRMGAQVISGIGFLGAGTILTDRRNRVRGLTTAAGLWASACIGLAVGGGFYIGGIVACLLVLITFTKFIDVEHHFVRKNRMLELQVSFDTEKNFNRFLCKLTSLECSIISLEYADPDEDSGSQDEKKKEDTEKEETGSQKVICAHMQILLPVKNYHLEILRALENSKGMITMEEG